MLSFQTLSTEALYDLHYQKPPNLATELTKVFQKVIQFREDNRKNIHASKLIKITIDHFVKNEAVEMLDVIKKYTGLNLKCAVSSTPFYNFAISFHFGEYDRNSDADFPTTAAIAARYTGQISDDLYKEFEKEYKSVKTQEELIKLSKTILNDTAAIKAGMFEKHGMKGTLYFCPYLAFFAKEVFGGKNFEYMTAEELSAIICHECGHAVSFIVHACDLCYKKDILYTGVKHAIKNFDQSEKQKLSLDLIKKLYPEKGEKFAKKISELQEKKNKLSAGEAIVNPIAAFIILINKLVGSVIYLAIRLFIEVFVVAFGGLFVHGSSYNKYGKFSDYSHSSMAGGYYEEELADEYVSKMGYSHHLASSLHKIERAIRFIGTDGYHNVKGVDYYFRLLPWIAASLFTGYNEDFIHPDEYKREENMMMDMIKAFKSDHMDPKLIDDYYKAFKFIKDMHEEKSFEKSWEKANHAIGEFVEYVISTPFNMLYEGRFKEEYDRLFNHTQTLMNNQLYALSYGLKKKAGNS